ncbi:MAG: hypothetical protein IJV85_02390 [Clostridia bacterium]|nr:hypothetical protein [Clostridia bacterium]
MNYVKKMCILRQLKQGFSGDGKSLSGLIKVEQYGKNLAVEVSVINFAPLVSGEYYCILADSEGKSEMLSLRGKSLFNILSDLDVSGGFCGIICYVKNDIVPIAYGVNGNRTYDWRSILNATLPPTFYPSEPKNTAFTTAEPLPETPKIPETPPSKTPIQSEPTPAIKEAETPTATEEPPITIAEPENSRYNDDSVAMENYYRKEEENYEQQLSEKIGENAFAKSPAQEQSPKKGADAPQNVDAEDVLHPFAKDTDGYYLSVKSELDELFKRYPRDNTLKGAFSCGEWVRIKGDKKNPQYLVGVIYEEWKAKYICYALAAENRHNPPEEIKNVCSFVPSSPYDEDVGFFVIFQSAASGECIRPEQA